MLAQPASHVKIKKIDIIIIRIRQISLARIRIGRIIRTILLESERDLALLAYLDEHGIVPAARVEVSEVAAWNEVVNLVTPKGEASLGFKAAAPSGRTPESRIAKTIRQRAQLVLKSYAFT